MGAKKRKDEEAEEEGGRGKRTKKPSNKWAMSGAFENTIWIFGVIDLTFLTAREEEIRQAIEAGKEKASPEKPKKKLTGKGVPDESLHPDACYICRELKSKEDKQNKMIGNANAMTITSLNFFQFRLRRTLWLVVPLELHWHDQVRLLHFSQLGKCTLYVF